jgi:hypothetical protein
MATIGLVIAVLAFLVSLLFNLFQLRWRKDEQAARADDKAEQKRKDDERETGQRLKEQAAPLFFTSTERPARYWSPEVSIRHKGRSCMCGVL